MANLTVSTYQFHIKGFTVELDQDEAPRSITHEELYEATAAKDSLIPTIVDSVDAQGEPVYITQHLSLAEWLEVCSPAFIKWTLAEIINKKEAKPATTITSLRALIAQPLKRTA